MSEKNSTPNSVPSPNYPALKEFQVVSKILKLIPSQAQKGLSSFNVNFTCVDVVDEYIAIGTSVGVLYLYDRKCEKLHKLRNENYRDPLTSIKLCVSLECLVAFGCQSGLVLAFKVPFDSKTEVEKFTVQDLHNCSVTAIEWAKNGLKFFSGDQQGVVVCTEIDHMEHQSRSRVIMTEGSEIVQLSYSRLNLLVSTLYRSVLYSFKDGQIIQIGQKDRKCPGRFGAVFLDHNNGSGFLFASRQGQRLWKSDTTGVIQETIVFKSALTQPHDNINLLSSLFPSNSSECPLGSFQFGPLRIYDGKYILMWSDSALVLIDPEHQAIVASCCHLYPIVSVATSNDEIYVVQGLRHLIRIATEPETCFPDNGSEEEMSVIDELLVPFKELKSAFKERSESLSVQTESHSIFGWMKKSRSSSMPDTFENKVNDKDYRLEENGNSEDKVDSNETEENFNSPVVLPDVVRLDSKDYKPIHIPDSLPLIFSKEAKINNLSKISLGDDIVFKPHKKKNKKKVRFANDKSSTPLDNKSLQNDNINLKESGNVQQGDNKNQDSSTATETSPLSKNSQENIEANDNSTDSDAANANVIIEENGNCLPAEDATENENVRQDSVESDKSVSTIDSDAITSENLADVNDINCDNPTSPIGIYSQSMYDTEQPDIEIKNQPLMNIAEDSPDQAIEQLLNDEHPPDSLNDDESEPPKYGLHWVEYKANEILLDLSISNEHIFWVDVNNELYFSNYPELGLAWTKVDQPAEKVAVSPLETVVWCLYKGTVYAAAQKGSEDWKKAEWQSIARDVVSMAVDDDGGWYVLSRGELITQQKLDNNYPQTVHCPLSITQVACRNNVVWLLSTSGILYYREHGNVQLTSKSRWIEIILTEIASVSSIYLGTDQTGWIVDNNGHIWFLIGVTATTPTGIGEPWQVESSGYLQQSTVDLKSVVMKALNSDMMTRLLKGKQELCLAASQLGVWFCKTLEPHLYCNQERIIGHSWQPVVPVGTASATKWTAISAKGVLKATGSIWCMTITNELLCLSASTKNVYSVELPCSEEKVKCMEAMPHRLWLLTSEGNIFVRRGIDSQHKQGVWWQSLDLSQLSGVHLCHISCSSDIVWACSTDGRVYVRMGHLNPTEATLLSQAWIPIDSAMDTSSPFFNRVCVGPQSFMVWALDDQRCVYVREGITYNMPIGQKWTLIPDLHAKELCISDTAVWIVKNSGKVYRRFGISDSNPMGDYWKLIPGSVDYLSATSDDDLWGLHENGILSHTSFALDNALQNSRQAFKTRTISFEDWEDIMTDGT